MWEYYDGILNGEKRNMRKIKQIFTNWRIILMLLVLILSLTSINPHFFRDGVAIRNVELNSSAALAGIEPPLPQDQPVSRERIVSVNDNPVETAEDYYQITQQFGINDTVYVKTNKARYRLLVKEAFTYHETNETEFITIEDVLVVNETVNGTEQEVVKKINTTVERPRVEKRSAGPADLGLTIYPAPTSNIKKGLDLQGGTRVLLQPEVFLTPVDLETLIDSMKQRLNVYGLSDISVKPAGDLPPPLGEGNQYILVEVAGVSEAEIKDLLAKQGKFEAKIAGTTVFKGGDEITFVCRSAQCSGIDPNRGCSPSNGQTICGFYFSITLSRQAAERQALATSTLEVIQDQGGAYLSSPLELHLDDQKVDELNIAAGLKGEATTNIQITGSGVGSSVEAAGFNAIQNMKRLQTILITGSLPVKMDVVKVDEVSPVLGKEFVKNSIIMAVVAILAVAIIVGIRYRKPIISVPIMITMTAEIIILLGVASLIKWNIDLAAIAGIIAAIGTGVDHQIVITDEALRGSQISTYNWKERVKRAFLIIMLAYMTIFAAMFPLIFAGAGLLKGFAITTLAGVTIGVLITRPAFSAILEILLK